MLSQFLQLIRRRPILSIILLLSTAFILLNLTAYKHAYAMLHFTQQGKRTERPESLSFLQKVKILLTGVNIPKPLNDSTPDQCDLPFEVHHFKINNGLELEAWYIPHPQAKGIVLMFHGYASSKSSLLPEANALNEMGYATFLVDFRGSGGTDGNETSIGFYEAEDVLKAIEYVRGMSLNQPIILYGQSMGGAAILRAIYANDVQPDAIIIEAVFDKMLSTVQNRFSAMGLPSFPGAHFLVFWGGVQNGFSGFRHNPVEYAIEVQCPVLILHGTDDPRATIDQAKAVFQNLSGPKQFERFAGVGHESYFEVEPDKWKRTISGFLAQQR